MSAARPQPADLGYVPLVCEQTEDDGPVCGSSPYPHVKPGIYTLQCVRARRYQDPRFRRWVCELKFMSPDLSEPLFGFMHLGDGKKAPGRGSRFYQAWTLANDGLPPKRHQRMSLKLFQGCWFECEVKDVREDRNKAKYPDGLIYSVVSSLRSLAWKPPNPLTKKPVTKQPTYQRTN